MNFCFTELSISLGGLKLCLPGSLSQNLWERAAPNRSGIDEVLFGVEVLVKVGVQCSRVLGRLVGLVPFCRSMCQYNVLGQSLAAAC